jgi:hypothetical protein
MKGISPTHAHISHPYLRLDFEFLPTLAEEDLSVPIGWKKSRQSQTAATIKRVVPTHSHVSQAYLVPNLEFLHRSTKSWLTLLGLQAERSPRRQICRCRI